MTEKPILFSSAMVRAIIAGIKTQTRRVVKRVRSLGEPGEWCHKVDRAQFAEMVGDYRRFCPYGQPGDRLWVRETWCPSFATDDDSHNGYCYLATNNGPEPAKWRPSIHMPRAASRLTLELTAVRVERLQDISADDAVAEGSLFGMMPAVNGRPITDAEIVDQYRVLWDSINAKRGYGWDTNCYVWVLTFRLANDAAVARKPPQADGSEKG